MRTVIAATLSAWCLLAAAGRADDVRYFEKDGITYKETRRVVQRPVTEVRYEQREQMFYRQQFRTEMQQQTRVVQHPITQYQYKPQLVGRWNPFVTPYYSYQLVPTTRWETRQEQVQIPINRSEWVAEKRAVQVPVTTQRMAEEEVITRVAVSMAPRTNTAVAAQAPAAGGATRPLVSSVTPSTSPAASNPIGGIARLDSEPPRRSTQSPAAPISAPALPTTRTATSTQPITQPAPPAPFPGAIQLPGAPVKRY